MFPWSHAPTEIPRPNDAGGLGSVDDVPSPAVGDVVYSGQCRGSVVSVDASENAMGIIWDDSEGKYGVIIYPIDATYLRKAMPWE